MIRAFSSPLRCQVFHLSLVEGARGEGWGPRNYSGSSGAWHMGCSSAHASSAFHSLDQPSFLRHPLLFWFSRTLQRICFSSFLGVLTPSPPVLSVGGLAAGRRVAALRQTEVNKFFPLQGGLHPISREGDLCATRGEVSQGGRWVGRGCLWLPQIWIETGTLSCQSFSGGWGGSRVSDIPMLSPPCGLLVTPSLFWKQIGVLGPPRPFLVACDAGSIRRKE